MAGKEKNENLRERQARFSQSQKDKGMIRKWVWIPKDKEKEFLEFVENIKIAPH